jgi:hypothetical protein
VMNNNNVDENHHQQFGAVCGNDSIVLAKRKIWKW